MTFAMLLNIAIILTIIAIGGVVFLFILIGLTLHFLDRK